MTNTVSTVPRAATAITTTAAESADRKDSQMTPDALVQRRFGWLGVLVMLAVLAAPARPQSSPPDQPGGDDGPVNAMCPVTTDEPVDPRFTVEYQGHTIGFCCRKCLTRFQADPTTYVANLPVSFSPAAQDTGDPHEHADHDEGHEHADVARLRLQVQARMTRSMITSIRTRANVARNSLSGLASFTRLQRTCRSAC